MKITTLIAAAGLAFAGLAGTATAASAATVTVAASVQDYGGHRGYRNNDRRWDRGQHRGWERHRGYNRRHRARRVCWTEWRRYQGRVTVCRRRR